MEKSPEKSHPIMFNLRNITDFLRSKEIIVLLSLFKMNKDQENYIWEILLKKRAG